MYLPPELKSQTEAAAAPGMSRTFHRPLAWASQGLHWHLCARGHVCLVLMQAHCYMLICPGNRSTHFWNERGLDFLLQKDKVVWVIKLKFNQEIWSARFHLSLFPIALSCLGVQTLSSAENWRAAGRWVEHCPHSEFLRPSSRTEHSPQQIPSSSPCAMFLFCRLFRTEYSSTYHVTV